MLPYDHSFPDYRILGGLLIVAGAVGGSINSSSGRAVMSWFHERERGFAMSIRQTALPVGGAMGTVLFPFFAGRYGFRVSFLFLTVLYFAMAIGVGIGLKTFQARLHNGENNDLKMLPSPFRRLSLWKLALSAGALTCPQMAVLTFASVYLTQVYHLGMLSISVLLAGIQLGGGILRIVTGKLSDTYNNRCQILCMIALIAGLSSIILGVAANYSVQVVVFFLILIGLSGNAWHGVAYTEIAVLAGVHYSGRALGMIGTTVFVATFVIPYVIPHMLRAFSWNGVWIMVGIASLAALPLMYEFIKKVEV